MPRMTSASASDSAAGNTGAQPRVATENGVIVPCSDALDVACLAAILALIGAVVFFIL